jgi:hypothetical protein
VTYSHNDPNNGAGQQDRDCKLNISNAEHSPIKRKDGDLGKEESERVEMFDDKEVLFRRVVCFFYGHALNII